MAYRIDANPSPYSLTYYWTDLVWLSPCIQSSIWTPSCSERDPKTLTLFSFCDMIKGSRDTQDRTVSYGSMRSDTFLKVLLISKIQITIFSNILSFRTPLHIWFFFKMTCSHLMTWLIRQYRGHIGFWPSWYSVQYQFLNHWCLAKIHVNLVSYKPDTRWNIKYAMRKLSKEKEKDHMSQVKQCEYKIIHQQSEVIIKIR